MPRPAPDRGEPGGRRTRALVESQWMLEQERAQHPGRNAGHRADARRLRVVLGPERARARSPCPPPSSAAHRADHEVLRRGPGDVAERGRAIAPPPTPSNRPPSVGAASRPTRRPPGSAPVGRPGRRTPCRPRRRPGRSPAERGIVLREREPGGAERARRPWWPRRRRGLPRGDRHREPATEQPAQERAAGGHRQILRGRREVLRQHAGPTRDRPSRRAARRPASCRSEACETCPRD